MGLLDKIFGKLTKQNIEDKNLPSFWEDDYCQVEIVPRKNLETIRKAITEIDEFTKKTQTEYGFTDILIRDDLIFPTLNEEIRIDYFEKIMADKGFEKAKQIRYDGSKIIDCSNTTSNAFYLPCINFFYDCKEEFINNIWIFSSLITSTDDFNKTSEILYELGESCELILVDWNSSEIIDLADNKQIRNYLMKNWK